MTSKELWEKRNWFLFLIGYFAIGYVSINWINEGRSFYFDAALPFEGSIPFYSFFIMGYLFVYVSMLVLYFLIDDMRLMHRAVVAFLILTTTCYIVYLVFPVQMVDRPDIKTMIMRTWIDKVVRAYFILDRPYNALPSIHASYPMLATCLVWKRRPVGRFVLLAMTAIICVSVVLVKQHYVMDVLTGLFAALMSYLITRMTEKRWKRWFKPSSG